jgi:hypothetical protein
MRLDELNLSISEPLKLTITGLDYKRHHCKAELVGLKKDKTLILHLPAKPPQVLLQEDMVIRVEIALPKGNVSFETGIDRIQEQPSLILHCDYPVGIDYQKRREEIRVPLDTPVTVVGHTKMNMDTYLIKGHILDVSFSGARIVLEKELTKMVTHLSLTVLLSDGVIEKEVKLTAKIRNPSEPSKEHPECGFSYGLKFMDVPEMESLFLRVICLQHIQQQKLLRCE